MNPGRFSVCVNTDQTTMKQNKEYKQAERERKKKAGLKRLSDIWVYPVDEIKIKTYIYMLTEETRKLKENT